MQVEYALFFTELFKFFIVFIEDSSEPFERSLELLEVILQHLFCFWTLIVLLRRGQLEIELLELSNQFFIQGLERIHLLVIGFQNLFKFAIIFKNWKTLFGHWKFRAYLLLNLLNFVWILSLHLKNILIHFKYLLVSLLHIMILL